MCIATLRMTLRSSLKSVQTERGPCRHSARSLCVHSERNCFSRICDSARLADWAVRCCILDSKQPPIMLNYTGNGRATGSARSVWTTVRTRSGRNTSPRLFPSKVIDSLSQPRKSRNSVRLDESWGNACASKLGTTQCAPYRVVHSPKSSGRLLSLRVSKSQLCQKRSCCKVGSVHEGDATDIRCWGRSL